MEFLDLLEQAIESEAGNASEVARKIGISKTTICLMRKGEYKIKSMKHENSLKREYAHLFDNQILCPVLGEIHQNTCKRYKAAAVENRPLREGIFAQVRGVCGICKIGENLIAQG